MSAHESTPNRDVGRLGFSSEKDVELFVETLEKFETGELTPDEWRMFRLVNGVYGQRQDDVQMVRVKLPQGIATAEQLDILGEATERWGHGKGHITTRQNIQYHFLPLQDAVQMLELFAKHGLTTKEACGNAVRNITQSPYAGVDPAEVFDPSPYAEAVTRFLLRGPYSSKLPRKFKIAFTGRDDADDIGGFFHDIGFFARLDENGRKGFKVVVGGGLSTLRRDAIVAHEFAPAEEIFEISEAVVRLFDRTGDRKHRHKARLKFVVAKLGLENFLAEYQVEREKVRSEGGRPLVLGESPTLVAKPIVEVAPAPGFDEFRKLNVMAQKQPGYVAVTVKITLGDLSAQQFRGLADIARHFSEENEARATIEQNFVFRHIREENLPAVHAALVSLGLADPGALTVLDVVSCPGAMSCKLAVTHSRGIASHVQEFLKGRPDLVAKAPELSMKASGCPNSCGQHHIAGIGWQGGVKKIGGRAAPLYHLYIGGSMGLQGAAFGRLAAKVPARRSTLVTERLINLYDSEKNEGESPNQFFGRVELSRVKTALEDLLVFDESNAVELDFVDLGQTEAFEVVLGEGECAA